MKGLESLSKAVFERRSSAVSGRFAFLGSDLARIFGQIVSIRVKKLSKTDLVATRHIKMKKGTLRVEVASSKNVLAQAP